MQNKTYTTFDIAEILDVYPKTVGNWVDDGKLKAFVTPGGHRRVASDDLLFFLRKYNMPIPPQLIQGGRGRILIVDDDVKVLDVIVRTLSRGKNKYEIRTATDGFLAGQMFNDFNPHLVVLDIMLPGIDGFKVCGMIRKRNKNVKIIAVSGFGTEENREKILKAGADEFLSKPVNIKILMEKMEKLMGSDAFPKQTSL